MLTEIYIEALLVDEELADQVWQAWGGRLMPVRRIGVVGDFVKRRKAGLGE